MLIRNRKAYDVASSEITPKSLYMARRQFLKTAAFGGTGIAAASMVSPALALASREEVPVHGAKLEGVVQSAWTQASVGLEPTPFDLVASYNNFYEFGTGKGRPLTEAKNFKPMPWTVKIDGDVEKPGTYDFEDLIKPHQLEERVYRLRCVEAWSMVVPWVGIPLADVIKRMGPGGNAKYVAFETLHDSKRMPGQKRPTIEWPYVEGLRMDEAMNPLTLLAVGLYGEVLPNQNGAPIRLVVPWKYGFKSIKSIVRISFVEKEPPTSWNKSQPKEYGFYANVNPEVDHPRWSQGKERRIGGAENVFGFTAKHPTLKFNGYEEEVAAMYQGMDLARYY